MSLLRCIQRISFTGAVIAAATAACAQEYPGKPVRIVTGAVASNSDFHARFLAQGLTGPLGQPVIVENRGGGVGTPQFVAKAAPDGYTLLVDSSGLWVTTLLQKTPYDTLRDFAPISTVSRSPYVLVVHPSLPAATVKELIALARANPGQLNYASGSAGTAGHLAAELFKSLAGINIVGISYASNSQEIGDVVSGQVQLTFWSGSRVIPLARAGKVRSLAVSSLQSSALFPNLPTMAAAGVPGYESVATIVLFAPAKTPDAIIGRLNQETVRFLNQAEVRRKLLESGIEAAASTPDELAATVKSSLATTARVIKAAGIRVE